MRVSRALGALLLLAATAAWSQQSAPEPRPGEGTIRGRLVHRALGRGAADAEVVLYALSAAGEAGLTRTRSDAEGRFAFTEIATEDTTYLVGARVAGIPFGATVRFAAGESLREIEIEVYDATEDTAGVSAGALQLRLAQGCTHLRVWQRHTLRNPTATVMHIPESDRAGRAPIASFALPAEAAGFELPMGNQGIERTGAEVRFWGPLYPGEQEIEFGYGLPVASGQTALRVASSLGASQVEVALPEGHPTPRAAGLGPKSPLELEGSPHDAYRRAALEAGEPLSLQLPAPPLPGAELAIARGRLWLEMDDVVLTVSESHQLELERARERSGLPLLCLPTPAGAGELRVAPETRALGLALDPSGVLAIHGPIPAGPSELAFSYRVPVVALPLDFSRRFGTEVELLEVVIADMGLVPRTSRLHRRRPIRSEDRNYLALEAFSVGADETVTLQLARIANASGAGRSLAAVLVALGGMAALGFLLAPLRGAGEAGASAERSEAELAREAVYRAIDDLDEDLATGKLSPDDHRRMREELRAEAVALLRREREGSRATAPPESPRCPHCDADVRRGDRFCSQCGQTLAPQSGGAESAA